MDKVSLLLAQGADINTRDDRGRTPLHLAVENQNPNSKDLILLLFNSKELNYKAKDVEGKMACEMSTWSSGNLSARSNMAFLRGMIDQVEWEKEKQQAKLIENLIGIVNKQEEVLVKMQQQIEYLTLHQKQNEQLAQKTDPAYSPNMFRKN